MAQKIDRTVSLNTRWTDGELLVLLLEVGLAFWLQPFIAVILGILVALAVGGYVFFH